MKKRLIYLSIFIIIFAVVIAGYAIWNNKLNIAAYYKLDKLNVKYEKRFKQASKDEKQFEASDDFRVYADEVRAIRVTGSNLVKAKDYAIRGAEMIADGFAAGSEHQIGKGASLFNTSVYYLERFKDENIPSGKK